MLMTKGTYMMNHLKCNIFYIRFKGTCHLVIMMQEGINDGLLYNNLDMLLMFYFLYSFFMFGFFLYMEVSGFG